MKFKLCSSNGYWLRQVNNFIINLLAVILLTACTQEEDNVLVYLPTATTMPTVTPTLTVTATPTQTPVPELTATPTVTPDPWLEIQLSIVDAETNEAVIGNVFVGLRVDENLLSYPIEQNVSTVSFTMPRRVTRADAVYINVVAPGYQNRLLILPSEAKIQKILTFEVQMRKR